METSRRETPTSSCLATTSETSKAIGPMLDDDEPAPENEGPRDHDAVNHEDVGTWDRATGVEALERLGALIMTNAQVKNMTVAQHERGMGMLTLLGSARNANLTDAASIMRAYGSDPRMDANALIAAAENSKALVDLLGRQVRWENELENYMRRHELTEYEDGTDSQKEFMDKLMRKRANESAIHREICPAVVEIVRLCNAWTPAMHSMQERRCALPKRLDEGQKQLQALAKSMETKTCLGAGVVPGLAKREAMRLASYPEWIVFYNEQMAAQIAAIAAALIADPEATPRAPEVTTTIAKEWLRGRFLDTEAGRCGPKVWRLMVKTYTGKFYDFDALDPKRTNKHGEPMKLWSLEHIDPSAEAIAHTDRSSVQNLITNNAHSFGVLPDVLNNSDIMKDGSESLIKLAFWGTFSVNQAKREKQARCKGVMRAATIEFARQIQDGNLAYEPASFEAKDPAKVRTFMEDRSKRQVNLTAAAQQSDIKAMMQNMAKRAAAAAEEPAAKRSKPDAEADDASSAHTSDTIDEDEAEEQAAAPSAKALGKRPAAAAPAPAPAAASSSAAAAVLVWELETKTEEEYNDTKTKLGVEKVCNQKYRAKGSDAPFVLCEMTTGLGKNSTCRPCEKRAGKPSHGRCPATALLPGGHASGQKHKKTAKYKTTEWTGYCCNQDCADAMAKVLYKRQHEDVPYPEGFEWPPKKGAAGKRKRAA